MAAFHHLSDQLFMPAKWVKSLEVHPDEFTHEDEAKALRRGWSVETALWDRKLDEAIGSGVTRSVGREGIRNSVRLAVEGRDVHIKNGFHRVASVDDDMFIPITYSEEPERVKGLPEHSERSRETRGDELY